MANLTWSPGKVKKTTTLASTGAGITLHTKHVNVGSIFLFQLFFNYPLKWKFRNIVCKNLGQ